MDLKKDHFKTASNIHTYILLFAMRQKSFDKVGKRSGYFL